MASAIDPTKPVNGVPAVKGDLRDNLQAAKDEIETLQTDVAAISALTTVLTTTVDASLVDPLIRGAGGGEVAVEAGAFLKVDSDVADLTITVNAADISEGWSCGIAKWGPGFNVTIVGGTGLTLRSSGSSIIFAQHEARFLLRFGGVLFVS